MKKIRVFLVLVMLLLAACGSSVSESDIVTLSPTAIVEEIRETAVSPTATITPIPTNTALPTATPIPSPTPTVTPSPQGIIKQGDELLLQSQWEEAEIAYLQAIEIAPDDALAYARLARLYVYRPQTVEDAIVVAQQAVSLAPDDGHVLAYLLMAYLWNDQYDEALSIVDEVKLAAYNDPFALAMVAETYLSTGQYDEAKSSIQQAVALNVGRHGGDRDVHRVWIEILIYEDNLSQALQSANLLYGFPDDFMPTYVLLAKIFIEQGVAASAIIELVETGLQHDPDYVRLNWIYAVVLVDAGDSRAALAQCEHIAEIVPDSSLSAKCRAMVYTMDEDVESLRVEASLLARDFPDEYAGYLYSGIVGLMREDCEFASKRLEQSIVHNPYIAHVHIMKGMANICLGELETAVSDFTQARELDYYSGDVYYGLGSAYLLQEKYDEAYDNFLQAIRYDSTQSPSFDYLVGFGETLIEQGACRVALDDFTGLLLCIGDRLLDENEFAGAANAYSSVLYEEPENTEALNGLVNTFSQDGQCGAATVFMEQTEALNALSAESAEAVALCGERATGYLEELPFGALLAETAVVEEVESIVLAVDGIDLAYVELGYDEDVDGEYLLIEYVSDLKFEDERFEQQLDAVIYGATSAFVRAETEPEIMLIRIIDSGLIGPRVIYYLYRRNAMLWFNGAWSDEFYKQFWHSFVTEGQAG